MLVEGGAALAVPLQWLLGDRFAATLEERMDHLPPAAPALVHLPCRLLEVAGDATYLMRARAKIARGCASWGDQTKKMLFAVRHMLWHDPIFPDLARDFILRHPDPAVNEHAMAWLSQEKGYRLATWREDPELRRCLRGMLGRDAPTPRALSVLDRLHADTGTLTAAGAVTLSKTPEET